MNIRIEVSPTATQRASGIGYYTERLANALSQHAHTTVFASYYNFFNRQYNPTFNPKVVIEKHSLVPLRVYAKLQSHRLAFPFDEWSKPVDLTIFTNYARWPTVHSNYVATAIHDLTYLHYPELIEKNNLPHLQRVVPRAIKHSDLIITISETVKAELISLFALDPSKIVVTPIPPNPQFAVRSTIDVRKKYDIPTKEYFLFLGNIEPRKNITILIEAYTKLPKSIHSTHSLVVAGGVGWKSEAIMKAIDEAKKAGLPIIQTGYIDEKDKSALYQNATAFILPSIYEGFGMPILEAFASKTPVIASDIPVLREVGGKGACYFPVADSSLLRDVLVSMVTDPALGKSLTKVATKQLSTFSWTENANRIITATEQLSGRAR